MKPRRVAHLSCTLLLALALSSGAAARTAEPAAAALPEAVVESYTKALQAGDYLKSTDFMHPEALEKFRGMVLPLVESVGAESASLLPLFKGVADVAALKKLSPAEFFASFLGGLTAANPAVLAALSSGSMAALGSVAEGEMLHVVCRTSLGFEGIKINKMNVVSLKRAAGNWRVLLSGEIEGMAEALRKAFAGATASAAEPEPAAPAPPPEG